MRNWKTILIDDELLARQRLTRLLQPYDDIRIIAEADNGQSGLELIEQHQPDLVFLDIEMPVLTGLEMLAKLKTQPRIVFTTAYDQYAIQAFEQNSIDYLLKPIEKERLEKTITKLRGLESNPVHLPAEGETGREEQLSQLEQIVQQLQRRQKLKTLTVKTGDRILLLRLNEIIYAQAEEKYVYLFTSDGKKYLTDYTLAVLEERLPTQFVRIHRAHIINSEQIREIRRGFNGVYNFVLTGYEKSPVASSRGYAEELKKRFEL